MSNYLSEGMGEKLKQVRRALKLTQSQLAEKLDVKQSYYSLIEAGKAGLPLGKSPILFSDLGISERWFFDTEGTISDTHMFDSSKNRNTWEAREKDIEERVIKSKEVEFYKNLIKEKDSRIDDLKDLVNTKDQLIKLLYEKISR